MMSGKWLKTLEEMFQENTIKTIKVMAEKYCFNEEEALRWMNVREEVKIVKGKMREDKEVKEKKVKEKKEKKEGPKMVLPFCGRIVKEWCEGVRMNHGLYSQCTSEKSGEKYCKSCKNQAETNESGKPNLGDINERMNVSSAEYRAEKGKKSVVYSVVMKKLKITKEEAVAEALKYGLEIPEEEFEMPEMRRGRPKKLSESESVKSGSDEGEKKRRGRPKKNKTMADNQTDETDDLIASLVAEANALKSSSGSEGEAETEEEKEAEVEEVEEVLLKGIVAKINADETYNKMNSMVVAKNERKKHLNAMGDHIKTLLTEEEMILYTGAPEDEEVEEEEEEVEDEATRKAREAAEKKAQLEAEKKAKKEQAEMEKKAKKEQAEAEKKAKAEAEKKAKKEQAEMEKKAKKEQAEMEKKAKKEQAEAEKKAKKEQADLEKKAKVEVTAVENKASDEPQSEAVDEPNESETVTAKVFEFQGKKYLKTDEGILYDQATEECVGVWNEETKSIDDFADDEE